MINKKLRRKVYNKFDGHCAYCGASIKYKNMQVDHIIPQNRYSEQYKCLVVKGVLFTEYGLHDYENLNPACRVCNGWKSTFTVDKFRQELEDQIKRLRLRSSNFRMAEKYKMIEIKTEKVLFYFEVETPTKTE